MKTRFTAVAAVGVAIALTASGCAASSSPSGGDASALRWALGSDPGALNPVTNATEAAQQINALSYESLVSFPAAAEPSGLLAESWTESPTELTVVLKDGITCSDGSTLTASDVKASFDYASAEETASPFAGVYFPASGFAVAADDATSTVTFTSEQPQSFLLQTIGFMPIVCAAGLADPTALDTKSFGTGPYVLDDASADGYTYSLRDDYSDTEGLPATVDVQVVTDNATRANMLQSKQVDLAEIGGTDRDRLKSSSLTTVDVPARPGQLFFNQAPGRAGNSAEVRQAIAQAIDRESVEKVATGGHGKLLNSLQGSLSSVCLGQDSADSVPEFDVAAAEDLLDAAGYIEGSDGTRSKDGTPLSLVLLYPSDSDSGVAAAVELVQEQLADVGITATPTPSSAYTDVIFQGGDWDLVWAPIAATLPSVWAGILSGDTPPNGGNWTYNTNQEYFDLTAQAQQLAGDESCDAWLSAQDLLFSDTIVYPISESSSTIYASGFGLGVDTNGLVIPSTLRAGE
jgi:peptide/nickel transport system substrate-binding protein